MSVDVLYMPRARLYFKCNTCIDNKNQDGVVNTALGIFIFSLVHMRMCEVSLKSMDF